MNATALPGYEPQARDEEKGREDDDDGGQDASVDHVATLHRGRGLDNGSCGSDVLAISQIEDALASDATKFAN
jgi:hypothetical protein